MNRFLLKDFIFIYLCLFFIFLWDIWKDEIDRKLRSALLVREWPKLRSEYSSFPYFRELVDSVQKGSAPRRTG